MIFTCKSDNEPLVIAINQVDNFYDFTPGGNHFQDSIELGIQGLNAIRYAYKLRDERKDNESAKKTNYTSEEIEIAKSLISEREERKWTDEDMKKCFEKSRSKTNVFGIDFYHIDSFQNYLKSLKND